MRAEFAVQQKSKIFHTMRRLNKIIKQFIIEVNNNSFARKTCGTNFNNIKNHTISMRDFAQNQSQAVRVCTHDH
jgi:hypothetical protein